MVRKDYEIISKGFLLINNIAITAEGYYRIEYTRLMMRLNMS